MNYYTQARVRNSILNFVYSGSPEPRREGAFYNEKIGKIQRKSPKGENDSIFVLDSEEILTQALRSGAKAFYASYWRYSNPSETSGIKGRDLAWTVEAKEGGITVAKEITNLFIEALENEGFPQPLVKYSGEIGFDILIPLEDVQMESSENLNFLSNVQNELTEYASQYIQSQSSFKLQNKESKIRFLGETGTCLLKEHRWRRGLLLAPMSLHPSSGLVSVPLLPSEVSEFSVIEATPKKVNPRDWDITKRKAGVEPEIPAGVVSGSSI